MHWQLTGEKVLGIGDASGMFPIDIAHRRLRRHACWPQFDQLAAEAGVELRLADLLPDDPLAGRAGRRRSPKPGRELLDPTGRLRPGVPVCPPEGDAGTGMVATNSVAPRTGNVSAGTSIFAMVVLEHELSRVHRELDLVTTPAGDLVAMVHCNNGASELNAWVGLFAEFAAALGADVGHLDGLRDPVHAPRWTAPPTAAGCWPTTTSPASRSPSLEEGRPLFLRSPDSGFDLATFMRTQLYASLATLRIGMDVLQKDEGVRLDRMFAHGGLFKTKGVAQRLPGRRDRHPGLGRRRRRRGWRLGHRRPGRLRHRSHPRPEPGRLPGHPGLRRHCARHGRARPGRRRRLRRIHPALRRGPAGRAGGRRAHLTNSTKSRRSTRLDRTRCRVVAAE